METKKIIIYNRQAFELQKIIQTCQDLVEENVCYGLENLDYVQFLILAIEKDLEILGNLGLPEELKPEDRNS